MYTFLVCNHGIRRSCWLTKLQIFFTEFPWVPSGGKRFCQPTRLSGLQLQTSNMKRRRTLTQFNLENKIYLNQHLFFIFYCTISVCMYHKVVVLPFINKTFFSKKGYLLSFAETKMTTCNRSKQRRNRIPIYYSRWAHKTACNNRILISNTKTA